MAAAYREAAGDRLRGVASELRRRLLAALGVPHHIGSTQHHGHDHHQQIVCSRRSCQGSADESHTMNRGGGSGVELLTYLQPHNGYNPQCQPDDGLHVTCATSTKC